MQFSLALPFAGLGQVSEISLANDDGSIEFDKRILPDGPISYPQPDGTRRLIDFNAGYRRNLIDSFEANAQGSEGVPFQLADADNRHTWDPERQRGDIVGLREAAPGEDPGLWARVRCRSKDAAKSIIENGFKLPVSALIRENVERVDGAKFPAVLGHVLGTLNPRVVDLGGWRPVTLSAGDDETVIDLTGVDYKEIQVADPAVELTDAEVEQILLEAEAALAGDVTPAEVASAAPTPVEATPAVVTPAPAAVGLANGGEREVALAAELEATRGGLRVMQAQLQKSKWQETRTRLAGAGVPAADIALADSVMAGVVEPGAGVLALSEVDDAGALTARTVDPRGVILALLESRKGTVALGEPGGLNETVLDDEAEKAEAATVAAWNGKAK